MRSVSRLNSSPLVDSVEALAENVMTRRMLSCDGTCIRVCLRLKRKLKLN